MGIIDIFSKRGRALPDVYVYDQLPEKLRAQIVHILQDHIDPRREEPWQQLASIVAREHGLLQLPGYYATRMSAYDPPQDPGVCLNYVLQADAVLALDLVELAFRLLTSSDQFASWRRQGSDPDKAVLELNHRFRENGCGYQYERDQIVRVDSTLLHAEVVKPALALLAGEGFAGPNREFISAYAHFRHQREEEAIADAAKAFESTMKVICDERRWRYDARATAKDLIKVVIENGLVPKYSLEQLENVAKCLQGVATIRNKNAGHGSGATPRSVPEHYAAYALHLAAANIVFLVACHHALEP